MSKPTYYGCKYLADAFGNCVECKKTAEAGTQMTEHKYSYYLNGTLYFVVLRNDEVGKFAERYGVSLTRID